MTLASGQHNLSATLPETIGGGREGGKYWRWGEGKQSTPGDNSQKCSLREYRISAAYFDIKMDGQDR